MINVALSRPRATPLRGALAFAADLTYLLGAFLDPEGGARLASVYNPLGAGITGVCEPQQPQHACCDGGGRELTDKSQVNP